MEEIEKGGKGRKQPSRETIPVEVLGQETQSKKQAVYDK